MKATICAPDDDDALERWRVLAAGAPLDVKIVVTGLAEKVVPELDRVEVDGKPVDIGALRKEAERPTFHPREKAWFTHLEVSGETFGSTSFKGARHASVLTVVVRAGEERAKASLLLVPKWQPVVACAISALTAICLLVGTIGLVRDQTAWELVVRISGGAAAVGALKLVMPRVNPFGLPLGGLTTRAGHALGALLVVLVGTLLLPKVLLVRIYNRTDQGLELVRGETSSLVVPKRGWVTTSTLDSAISPTSLKRWAQSAELKDSGLEPCFFWDPPADVGMSCGRKYDPDWQNWLFARQFGIDCKARRVEVDADALVECKSGLPNGRCEVEIATAGCKLVDAEHSFRARWVFDGEARGTTFCGGTATGIEDEIVRVKLPFDKIEKKGGAESGARHVCVQNPRGLAFGWARATVEAGPGFTAMTTKPSTMGSRIVSLPLGNDEESFTVSLQNAEEKPRTLGEVRCDGRRSDRCFSIQRVAAKNVRIKGMVASQPAARSSYESKIPTVAEPDGWMCLRPLDGCRATDPGAAVEPPTGAEIVLSDLALAVEAPTFEFPRNLTPKVMTLLDEAKRLGTLTCEAKRDSRVVIERATIEVPAGSGSLAVGDLEKDGYRSVWDPVEAKGGGAAWRCFVPSAEPTRVEAMLGPLAVQLDTKSRKITVGPQRSNAKRVDCKRCSGPGKKIKAGTCGPNTLDPEPAAGCSRAEWELCKCED